MKIQIKLKEGQKIYQSMAELPWQYGYMVGTVTMADNVGYAVIQTQHDEFDLARFNQILAFNWEG